jgi:endo-1,4-beta-xylanase
MRLSLLLILGVAGISAAADPPKPKPAADLPAIPELPDPFRFADGTPVRTPADWPRRRAELKALFEDYIYGHLPPKPAKMTVTRGDRQIDADSKVAIQPMNVTLEHEGKSLTLHVRLAMPTEAKGPVPVVVQGSFSLPGGGKFKGKGGAPGRRFAAHAGRGYAVAEFPFNEVAIDNRDRARTAGVYTLFGDRIDCGGLLAWAWGVHRVIDALEGVDGIDAKKVVVTGHSRYGKASLLAGAFDERIAVTVPSHSGAAGVAPFRFIYGKSEQLHNIAGAFPYWFRPDFNQFVGKVDRLPVDQHLLMALVAPRPLMDTEGTQDAWTNPEGAQLTHQAAKKVYAFLKAEGNLSIRFRPVGHIPSTEDLLDFADHVFFKKALPAEFGKLPYKEETKGFTWDVPK